MLYGNDVDWLLWENTFDAYFWKGTEREHVEKLRNLHDKTRNERIALDGLVGLCTPEMSRTHE